MANHLETFKRVPKMVVFDLDYTLWPFMIDACANPTLYKKKDNKVIDFQGRVVKHYPAIPDILTFLSENHIGISVASRNAVTEGAEKLLHLFGWNKYFQNKQIYVGRKYNHITSIKKTCNIELEDMLFFDDELRNIKDLERLGVVCVLVNNGMTMQVLMNGLKKFSNTRTEERNNNVII